MADTIVDGQVRSGTQQQWLSRNTHWGSWTGQNWNMVFVGVENAPAGSFPNPPYTKVAQTPIIREKPYLYVDDAGDYQVFVPALQSNSAGPSWANGTPAGQSLPISQFYIAKPGATAATLNAAARGRQGPAVHARHLQAERHPAGHPGRTPSSWASACRRSCPPTAPRPSRSRTWTASRSPAC